MSSQTQHFNSGEYRIRAIDFQGGNGKIIPVYRLGEPGRGEPTVLEFAKPFRIKLEYECLLPEPSEFSCGAGFALTFAETMEHAMYFNTNRPHSDDELRNYFETDFRKYRGMKGVVEAFITNLQVRPADYLLTAAILPNQPGDHIFYELHYMQYPIKVISTSASFPAAFYPRVRFTHKALPDDDVAPLVSAGMLSAGRKALPEDLRPERMFDDETLKHVYLAMKKAAE